MLDIGLIGKKIGMSREFFPIGISVPVTVLYIEKGRILDVITKEKRGYNAIKVGFGKVKNSKLTKSMKGVFSKKFLSFDFFSNKSERSQLILFLKSLFFLFFVLDFNFLDSFAPNSLAIPLTDAQSPLLGVSPIS